MPPLDENLKVNNNDVSDSWEAKSDVSEQQPHAFRMQIASPVQPSIFCFFEKTEFVRAYAEAMVDGEAQKRAGEDYDPEYRDVVMQKFDPNSQQR